MLTPLLRVAKSFRRAGKRLLSGPFRRLPPTAARLPGDYLELLNRRSPMTDPSFLLQSSAAKDLVELARDLQALLDIRTAAMAQPLSGIDIDFSSFGGEVPSRASH